MVGFGSTLINFNCHPAAVGASSTIRYRREQIPGADTEQIPGPEASDTQNTDTGALRIAPDTFMQILERPGQKKNH